MIETTLSTTMGSKIGVVKIRIQAWTGGGWWAFPTAVPPLERGDGTWSRMRLIGDGFSTRGCEIAASVEGGVRKCGA